MSTFNQSLTYGGVGQPKGEFFSPKCGRAVAQLLGTDRRTEFQRELVEGRDGEHEERAEGTECVRLRRASERHTHERGKQSRRDKRKKETKRKSSRK